ncbi:MAG: FtsW/RodA/SpoVE family cell cycle protein [Nocardioidaceae bacterium]
MSSLAAQASEFVYKRRGVAELFLLVLSLLVGIGAYAAVGLGVNGELPLDLLTYGSWLAALVVVAHVVIRLFAAYADPILLPIVSALNGLGLAMIYRIDLYRLSRDSEAHTYAPNQLVWMTLGVALFVGVLVLLRDHRRLQGLTYTAGLGALILLIMPLLPGIGHSVNGAQIWIRVGSIGFQPGELAKVLLVIAFAGYLVQHRDALALAGRRFLFIDLPRGRDLGPIMVMWLVSLGVLVFQNDLGSSLMFFGIFLVMLYVATERPGWLLVGGILFGAGATLGYFFISHVQVRVDSWLDPFAYDRGYQLRQGLYGMGWGGMVGRGWGGGQPYRTPLANSDFIFPSLGEELGLTGLIAVLLLFLMLVERAYRIALVSRDDLGKLLAVGFGAVFALQCFVVIGGVTRLIPSTGLTTPFLSYGGSSLVANWIIIGLLARISDSARRPAPEMQPVQMDDDTQVVKLR